MINKVLLGFLGASGSFLSSTFVAADDYDIWNYAPDLTNAPAPYPPITLNGDNATLQNTVGTRLFGWKGCSTDESNIISQAFDDMNKLVNVDAVKTIDWSDQAAKEFWGPASGANVIPDDRRAQIQRKVIFADRASRHVDGCTEIYTAAQQMWAYKWIGWGPTPPWMWYRYLWIEVGDTQTQS